MPTAPRAGQRAAGRHGARAQAGRHGPRRPDLSVAYAAAVAKVSAGEAGGLTEMRKLADGGYAPAQFYLAELYPGRQGGPEEGR